MNLEKTETEKLLIELPFDKMKEAVLLSFDSLMKNSYINPFKDIVEKVLKEKSNEIETVVKQIISDSIQDPQFKTKLGEVFMARMIESSMKK